jgi:hypothetical protein
MSTSLNWALTRVSQDIGILGYGPLGTERRPDDDGPMVVLSFPGGGLRVLASETAGAEESASYIANQAQDALIGHLFRAWPVVGDRPLFPSAESGVACWCLDGKPWCAVGQLAQALKAANPK